MASNHDDSDKTRTFHNLVKGTEVEHYRIIEKIGSGGMGEVYLAEDTELNRNVALKFLSTHLCQEEDCRARFKREAQASAKLSHPNIVTVHAVGEYHFRPFIVMEYVDGRTLRELIKDEEISVEYAVGTIGLICEALKTAHEAGITHRDIKPGNIIVDSIGRPRLLDFGLAAVKGTQKLTQTGSTLGTVGYMSPEQVRGEDVDARSDLFSLGVIFYEMITGKAPFAADNDAATINAILNQTPEPIERYKSDISGDLQRIISKLLEKDPDLRYQSAAGVISDLKRLSVDKAETITVKPKADWWNRYVVPAAVLILLIVILVLKPWKLEFGSSQDAIARENRLAIMYFDNLADPSDSLKLGEITTNLLITDLSESDYVQVISSQRLYDILKQIGHEGEKKIDQSMATEIANKANARWMLLGSILNTDPQIILTAQLVEVGTGNAVASQRIEGQVGERIFPLIDKLTVEIKNDLSLPQAALEEKDKPVIEATTGSLDAYRCFIEGFEYSGKMFNAEAENSFRKAIEYDSTFAIAYAILIDFAPEWEDEFLRVKMNQYAHKASHREQLYIMAFDAESRGDNDAYAENLNKILKRYPEEKLALFKLGWHEHATARNPEKGIKHLQELLQLDPFFKQAYNHLAYIYSEIENYDSSIWAINKYIELAPDEPNPYDSRGELYANHGDLDKAIESYKKALEIKPDFLMSASALGRIYVLKGMYAEAEVYFRKYISSSDEIDRAAGRHFLSLMPLHQGKFSRALDQLNKSIETDSLELGDSWPILQKIIRRVNIYYSFKRDFDSVLIEIDRARAIFNRLDSGNIFWNIFLRGFKDMAYASLGNNNETYHLIDYFNDKLSTMSANELKEFYFFRALTEYGRGNFDSALTIINSNSDFMRGTMYFQYLGICNLKTGRIGDAVAILEKFMVQYDSDNLSWPEFYVWNYYWLGQAYEASGWNDKAIEQYETFLDIWKNADPGIEEIEDARERLSKLKNKT
jgi:tetratricopeptide (TPR) repeat protein/predicted Ser/Thr protein kinase